jgi:hypothetical protein
MYYLCYHSNCKQRKFRRLTNLYNYMAGICLTP